jgi:hypothetical protein
MEAMHSTKIKIRIETIQMELDRNILKFPPEMSKD